MEYEASSRMVAAQFDAIRIIGIVLDSLLAVIEINGRLSGDDSSGFNVAEACSDTPLASTLTCCFLRKSSACCCGVGSNPMSVGWALKDIVISKRNHEDLCGLWSPDRTLIVPWWPL